MLQRFSDCKQAFWPVKLHLNWHLWQKTPYLRWLLSGRLLQNFFLCLWACPVQCYPCFHKARSLLFCGLPKSLLNKVSDLGPPKEMLPRSLIQSEGTLLSFLPIALPSITILFLLIFRSVNSTSIGTLNQDCMIFLYLTALCCSSWLLSIWV